MYGSDGGLERAVVAVRDPLFEDDYLWPTVFSIDSGETHDQGPVLAERLRDKLPTGLAGVAFWDACNTPPTVVADKSKRFNGYKRHIAADLDTELILACAITPANRPEEEATPNLQVDLARLPHRSEIGSLHIDRGYIGSSLVKDVLARRGEVLCKP